MESKVWAVDYPFAVEVDTEEMEYGLIVRPAVWGESPGVAGCWTTEMFTSLSDATAFANGVFDRMRKQRACLVSNA